MEIIQFVRKQSELKNNKMLSYCHISQGFAANWAGVVTASVCLTMNIEYEIKFLHTFEMTYKQVYTM